MSAAKRRRLAPHLILLAVALIASYTYILPYFVTGIEPTNRPPVANAGTNQTVNAGTVVMLDGQGSSDPDGNTLSYSWRQVAGRPTVTLQSADTTNPTFTAPSVNGQTSLTFELTVSDGTSSDTATVNITVKEILAPTPIPISSSIADGGFESGELLVGQSELYGRWGSTGSSYDGKVTITSEDKRYGVYSLKISSGSLNDPSKAAYVYQFFNFSNDTYSFSFWYKGEGKAVAEVLTGWSPTGLGNEDAKGAAYVVLGDEGFPADGQWHHVKIVQSALGQSWYLDGKTPSCHPYTRVVPDIVILGDVSGLDYGGTFYFDEISLDPYTIEELECRARLS